MKKNVLIGNGINIQFDTEKDKSTYRNSSIILRALKNVRDGKFDKVFEGTISGTDIYDGMVAMVDFLNTHMLKEIEGLKIPQNEDEMMTYFAIVTHYKKGVINPQDIMMEDYFYLYNHFNTWWNEKFPEEEKINMNLIYQGLRYILVDAIYNDGKIEDLYKSMIKFTSTLDSYDNIFTINYDENLDKLVQRQIYHLHGKFTELEDTFNPNTVLGYVNTHSEKSISMISGMEHIYSNAIMGFSGGMKTENMNIYNEQSMALTKVINALSNQNDEHIHQEYERLKNSVIPNEQYAFAKINAKLCKPELTFTEYPIEPFKQLSGELDIIGMSPSNDNHIIKIINDNDSIKKVIYYFTDTESRVIMNRNIKKERHLECRDMFKFWNNIGC